MTKDWPLDLPTCHSWSWFISVDRWSRKPDCSSFNQKNEWRRIGVNEYDRWCQGVVLQRRTKKSGTVISQGLILLLPMYFQTCSRSESRSLTCANCLLTHLVHTWNTYILFLCLSKPSSSFWVQLRSQLLRREFSHHSCLKSILCALPASTLQRHYLTHVIESLADNYLSVVYISYPSFKIINTSWGGLLSNFLCSLQHNLQHCWASNRNSESLCWLVANTQKVASKAHLYAKGGRGNHLSILCYLFYPRGPEAVPWSIPGDSPSLPGTGPCLQEGLAEVGSKQMGKRKRTFLTVRIKNALCFYLERHPFIWYNHVLCMDTVLARGIQWWENKGGGVPALLTQVSVWTQSALSCGPTP